MLFVHDATLHENFAVLANKPDGRQRQTLLRDIRLKRRKELARCIRLQLWSVRHEPDEAAENLLADVVASEGKRAKDGVDVPPLVGGEAFRRKGYLSGDAQLELIVGYLEEREQLADQDADVGLVDERVGQLESTTPDGDITVAQTVEDGVAMALYGICVYRNDLVERVEGDVAAGISVRFVRLLDLFRTHRMLLSRLLKNLPRMLIAMTRNPLSASMSRTVKTVSYRMEFPTFLLESVFVATW